MMEKLRGIGRLEGETLERFSRVGSRDHRTISRILNGPEARLPDGFQYEGDDKGMHAGFRVKWWADLTGLTCREAIFPTNPEFPNILPGEVSATAEYPLDTPITFFGHYALKDPYPSRILPNLACLDYGAGKGGYLCAYRWDGEQALSDEKFLTVTVQ